jgi:hypothetical protein
MNANNDDRKDERVSQFLSAAEQDAAPLDEVFLKRLREESTEAFMAAAGPASPPAGRYKIMNANTLRWVIPLAAAAAIVLLAVGVWPGDTKDGRVYAMADMPGLLHTARTLYLKGRMYVPPTVSPSQKQIAADFESWWDSANARWRMPYYSYSVSMAGTDIRLGETVCDGEYRMKLNHTDKSAQFEKFNALHRALEARRTFDELITRMNQAQNTRGFAKVGEETVNGEVLDIWEGVFRPGHQTSFKAQWWLAPHSGRIARVKTWSQAWSSSDWIPTWEYDKIERNIDPPAGIFDVSAPAGYTLLNAKETAEVSELQMQGSGNADNVSYVGHVAFQISNDAVILGWSSADAHATKSQAELFTDLGFGGPIPKVPFEVRALKKISQDRQVTYKGRHLAFTRTGDRYHEWALYVANREPLPEDSLSYTKIVQRYNVPRDSMWTSLTMGISDPISVDQEDFDFLVRGAMAELSDDNTAPADITYASVLRLIDEARAERKARQ